MQKIFENLSNQPKFFIGRLAEKLEAERDGSDSEYATFETVNGRIVTIRLADHNATVSNFDYRGEDDGISIVIAKVRGKNGGIVDDGDAHVVEYYYEGMDIRRASGKPLVEIIRSIQQSLYSGEYKDTTGLAKRDEVNADKLRQYKATTIEGLPLFFRTSTGEAYGFVKDGKIYIDPRIATAETPVHEYGHLWAEALRKANHAAWERLKNQVLGDRDVADYVKGLYPELTGDGLAEEVFVHFAGKRGAERLRRERDTMMDEANGVFEKARVAALFDRLARALKDFWQMSRDLFAGKVEGLENLSAEDFAEIMLSDLANKVRPNAGGAEGKDDVRFMMDMGDQSEEAREIYELPKRHGLKGYAATTCIRERSEIEQYRGFFPYSLIDRLYKE